MAQSKAKFGKEAQSVMAAGAKRIDLPEFKTYAVIWFPKDYAKSKDHRALYVLHGSNGNAYMGVYHQLAMAQKYHYGLVSLQWWEGGNRYKEPREIEAALFKTTQKIQKQYPIHPQQTGLETFSRSGSLSYEIAYWNKQLHHPRYKLIIVQSGGIPPTNPRPLITQLLNQTPSSAPLKDQAFFLYCGENDRECGKQQCEMMRNAKRIIEKLGGDVLRFIDDPNGGHGGLHNIPSYFEAATKAFLFRTPTPSSQNANQECCDVRR